MSEESATSVVAALDAAADVAVFVLDGDRTVAWANGAAERYLGLDRDSVLGLEAARLVREVLAPRMAEPDRFVRHALGDRSGSDGEGEGAGSGVGGDGRFECRVEAGDGRDERSLERRVRPVESGPYAGGLVELYYDVTGRERREQPQQRDREELATLDRTLGVIRDVDRALVEASTRAGIEEAVAERLAAGDAYALACIVDRDRTRGGATVRAAAGADDDFLRTVGVVTGGDEPVDSAGPDPVGAALASGEVRVAQSVADCSVDEEWRTAALERGYRSVAGIPIGYGEATYGVLGVYADRPYAFDGRERDVLVQLGETVGHAVAAVENRKLLLSNSLVELVLGVSNDASFFLGASARLGCRFEIRQIVPTADDGLLYYEHLTGTDPETVLDLAESDGSIEDARLITAGEDDALLEFTVSRSSPTMVLAENGAQVTEAVADRGEGHIVALVSPDTDVRALVERLQAEFTEVELRSKREVERDVETVHRFRRWALTEYLTGRQRAALEAAYYGGYFEWPRESTAEEVAAVVGISSPTLHYHLRHAQRNLLRTLLDEQVSGGPPADD